MSFETLVGVPQTIGRGKKVCPNCNIIVGARTLVCDCSYSFKEGKTGFQKEVVTKNNLFPGPGKGRKQCNSCKKYVGAKSLECPNCGATFIKKSLLPLDIKEEQTRELTAEERFAFSCGFNKTATVIHTPSGKCPYKIENLDKDSIFDWCELLLSYGRKDNKVYLPEAMIYWLRDFYTIDTKEYKDAKSIVYEWGNELESDPEVFEDSETDSDSE